MSELIKESGNLQNFIESFPVFAAAPGGVSKLRDLIVHFAVSGRLVEQFEGLNALPDYAENQKEKERLVKEKIIKEKKKMSAVSIETVPYKLPLTWMWARIGEVTSYGAAAKAEYSDVHENTWVLELEDIEKETSKLLARVSVRDRVFKSSKNRFKKGDVLYGKLRPYLDKVLVANEDGVCTTEIIPLYGFSGVDPYYLRWVMKSPYFKEYADGSTHGMGMPRMGTDKALAALFPFPPLEEQKRIVAKVDELMALCDQLEAQQQQQANTVLRANTAAINTLLNPDNQPATSSAEAPAGSPATSEPSSFEKNWQRIAQHFNTLYGCTLPMPPGKGRQKKHLVGLENIKALRLAILQLAVTGCLSGGMYDTLDSTKNTYLDLLESENAHLKEKNGQRKSKLTLPCSELASKPLPAGWSWVSVDQIAWKITDGEHATPKRTDSGYYLLSARNVTNEGINLSKVDYVGQGEFDRIRKRCDPGKGDVLISCSGSVGRICLVDKDDEYVMVRSAALLKLPLNLILNEYVKYALRSWLLQKQILKKSKTTAQSNLFLGKIKELTLPLPSLDEQKRIVAKVDELMNLCDQLEQQLTQAYGDAQKLMEATVKTLVA